MNENVTDTVHHVPYTSMGATLFIAISYQHQFNQVSQYILNETGDHLKKYIDVSAYQVDYNWYKTDTDEF